MFEVLSDNKRLIKRLIAGQLSLAIFSVVIAFATSNNKALTLAASIFCVCFYMFIVYSFMWEAGAKLAVRKEKPDKKNITSTSFVVLLTANLFNLLCAVLYTISKISYTITGDAKSSLTSMGTVIWTVIKFVQGMYMGIDAYIFSVPPEEYVPLIANPLYFYALLVPTFAVGMLAYKLGSDDISILRKMGFNIKPQARSERNYKSNWK